MKLILDPLSLYLYNLVVPCIKIFTTSCMNSPANLEAKISMSCTINMIRFAPQTLRFLQWIFASPFSGPAKASSPMSPNPSFSSVHLPQSGRLRAAQQIYLFRIGRSILCFWLGGRLVAGLDRPTFVTRRTWCRTLRRPPVRTSSSVVFRASVGTVDTPNGQ